MWRTVRLYLLAFALGSLLTALCIFTQGERVGGVLMHAGARLASAGGVTQPVTAEEIDAMAEVAVSQAALNMFGKGKR